MVSGLTWKMFFWALVTLVDIMLLGYRIEMKSVVGASTAIEELATLMPSEAHKLIPDGSAQDVQLSEPGVDHKVLVKPGEKISAEASSSGVRARSMRRCSHASRPPVTKTSGGKVTGNCINGEGSLTIEV